MKSQTEGIANTASKITCKGSNNQESSTDGRFNRGCGSKKPSYKCTDANSQWNYGYTTRDIRNRFLILKELKVFWVRKIGTGLKGSNEKTFQKSMGIRFTYVDSMLLMTWFMLYFKMSELRA